MLKLFRRGHYLFRRRRIEAELAAELEFHRAERQRQLEHEGLSTAEAVAASRRALGNLALAREDARHVWLAPWMESVWQDARYALRIVGRSPAFAISMIVVMSLGLGATIGVFSLIDALVLNKLPVREPERLVYLSRPSFSYPVLTELQARGTHVFASLIAWNMEREYVQWNSELEPTEVLMASGAFYSTLGIGASIGRTFGPRDDAIGGGPDGMVAVISHAAWRRRFGSDPRVVGRTIRIRREPFTIVGVAPAGFFGVAPGLAPDITIPLTVLQDQDALISRTSAWLHLMGRLHDGLDLRSANAALQNIWPGILEATTNAGMPADRRALYQSRTTSLESARAGFSRVRNRFEEPLWVLLALVGLLLAVATASGSNLLLARAAARGREFAVRLAVGAGRRRLVRQVVTEALVWTLLGAATGLILATWGADLLVVMMSTRENPIVLETGLNWRLAGITIALAFLAAATCAVLPALRATRLDAGATLKEFAQIHGRFARSWSGGKFLVTAQIALTVLLMFGAALFARSLQRIFAEDPGFESGSMLIVTTEASAAGYEGARHTAFYTSLVERLRAIPGVQSASLSKYPPISDDDGAWTQSVAVDGAPLQLDLMRQVHFNAVTPAYFRTTGMRLLQGRDFVDTDRAGSDSVVIVSESLGRQFFPGQNPLGRRIGIGRNESRRDMHIVGVVSDAKYQRLTEPTRSLAYVPRAQVQNVIDGDDLFAQIRFAGGSLTAAGHVRREVRALDAAVPIRLQTVADRIRVSLVQERVIAAIALTLALAALILACAGVYGLLAYNVSRQTNEIGLRLALGAERREMLWMVLRQSLVLGIGGVAVGFGASLALGQFARNLLYNVSETDIVALAAAGSVMLVVALVAGFFPARRAAHVDPIVALRTE
jgi:predicted permease